MRRRRPRSHGRKCRRYVFATIIQSTDLRGGECRRVILHTERADEGVLTVGHEVNRFFRYVPTSVRILGPLMTHPLSLVIGCIKKRANSRIAVRSVVARGYVYIPYCNT